jgi:hypothetical protein
MSAFAVYNRVRNDPELVRWTMNSLAAAIQDVGVNHRGADIGVPNSSSRS